MNGSAKSHWVGTSLLYGSSTSLVNGSLVHGSDGCSTFCVCAGWRAGSYTREMQHAKRDLFQRHIAGGSYIAMEKAIGRVILAPARVVLVLVVGSA